jgi:hypothetical protein
MEMETSERASLCSTLTTSLKTIGETRPNNGGKQLHNLKRLFKVAIVMFLVVAILSGCSSPNSDLSGWIGNYEYSASFSPDTPIGTTLYEAYYVSIYQDNDVYLADIIANGWMLGINARAQVRGDKNSIELIFMEYPETSMELFKEGDVIISLTNDGNNITTKWIGIAPELGANRGAEGVYFSKAKT